MVAAIEKWKVGIPKMKVRFCGCVPGKVQPESSVWVKYAGSEAKVISQEEFENFLEKSKTCLVFVKNLPEDCELDCSCTAPSQVSTVRKATRLLLLQSERQFDRILRIRPTSRTWERTLKKQRLSLIKNSE